MRPRETSLGDMMVPAGNAFEPEPQRPGELIGMRYVCQCCGAEVGPYARLGTGDQHLQHGALCGPVEEFEVRAALGQPQQG